MRNSNNNTHISSYRKVVSSEAVNMTEVNHTNKQAIAREWFGC